MSTSAQAALFAVLSMLVWAVFPIAIGWTPTTVMTGSMEPRIHPGDVVVARPVPPDAAAPGHILLVDDPDHENKLRLHRLVEFAPDGNLILRGDANAADDSSPVTPAAVHGVAVLRVPFVGLPMVWFAEKNWGPITAVLATLAALTLAAASGSASNSAAASGPASTKPRRNRGPRHRGPSRRGLRTRVRKTRAVQTLLVVAAVPALACTALTAAPPVSAAFSAAAPAPASSFAALSSFPCLSPTLSDNPYLFYPFTEGTGDTAYDARATELTDNRNGKLHGATRVPGSCLPGASPALSFSGISDGNSGYVSTPTKLTPPSTFTLEIWFKTTTTKGGRLIGFGDQQLLPSQTADRHLYMTDAGAITFGVLSRNGAQITVISPNGYNDGKWHQATAVMGPPSTGNGSSLSLYVDGIKLPLINFNPGSSYPGYWRIGYDAMPATNGKDGFTSPFFKGDVGNAAIYHTALSEIQVNAHYNQTKCRYTTCA